MPISNISTRGFLAAIVAIAGIATCAHFGPTPYPLYPNPARPLPAHQLAMLNGPVAAVDGVDVSRLGTLFSLLPGCHVVEMQENIGEGSVSGAWSATLAPRAYAFRMQPGRSYGIEIRRQTTGSIIGWLKIDAVERDGSGAVLGHVAPLRSDAELQACRAWSAEPSPSR
jgi:hypothetical protein